MEKETKKRFNFPEGDKKEEKFITNINTICKACDYHNIGNYSLDEDMPIVCCGSCGAFLVVPNNMNKKDKEAMKLCVQQALEDLNDDTNSMDDNK